MTDSGAGNSDQRYLVRNAQVVKPTRLLTGDICIENGIVSYIGEPLEDTRGYIVINASRHYAIPGFIDIHTHGGTGFDLTAGEYDPVSRTFDGSPEMYERALPRLMRRLAENGTTRVVLATVAESEERLQTVLGHLGEYVHGDQNGRDGSFLHGALLEGTFIQNPDFSGAQNPDHFQKPSTELFDRLREASRDTLCYVNVVPDYGDSALHLIRHLVRDGVVAGAGHTGASADAYLRAVDSGLRVAIHFTNGPTGSSLKPFGGGGVLQAVLSSRRVYAELILDGYHVNPAYVLDVIKRKGADRIVAVTDSMFPVDAVGIEDFEVSGVAGRLSENGGYLQCVGKPGTLFGSVLKMRVAFGNLISWFTRRMRGIWNDEHLPMELDEAVLTASQLCSVNPATALGIFDPSSRFLNQDLSTCVGGLQVGKRADIALVRIVGQPGEYEIDVEHVFVGGRLMQ